MNAECQAQKLIKHKIVLRIHTSDLISETYLLHISLLFTIINQKLIKVLKKTKKKENLFPALQWLSIYRENMKRLGLEPAIKYS